MLLRGFVVYSGFLGTFQSVKYGSLYIAICIIVSASALMLLHLIHGNFPFPFSSDSASYIDQARNLIKIGQPAVTPFGIDPSNIDQVPSDTFPPGFPLVLAALALLGIDPRWGAISASWFSAIVLPFAIYWACRGWMTPIFAASAAFLGSLSAGVVENAGLGLTDNFALLLSFIAFGALCRSNAPSGAAASGFIAAFAYVVRYQQAALVLSLGLVLLIVFIADHRSNNLARLLAFATGVFLVLLPYLAWNIHEFGEVLPYQSGRSTVPFGRNVLDYLYALLRDLTATRFIPDVLTRSVQGLVILGGLVVFSAVALASVGACTSDRSRVGVTFCILYTLIGGALVILARSRFQWGEFIGVRHTLQYSPFVFVGVLTLLDSKKRNNIDSTFQLCGRLFLTICLASLGFSEALRVLRQPTSPQASVELSVWRNGSEFVCERPNTFTISNWSHVFRILCGAPVRFSGRFNLGRDPNQLDFTERKINLTIVSGIEQMIPHLPTGRRTVIALFPGRAGVDTTDLPLSKMEQERLVSLGWAIVNNDPDKLILSYDTIGSKG